jgi:hypothetical protein
VDLLPGVGALVEGVVVDCLDVGERRAVCGEEALQHGLQRGPELSAERSCKLPAAEAGDGEERGGVPGGGMGIDVVEHRQEASLVEAVVAIRAEGAVRTGDFRPVGGLLAQSITQQGSRGENQRADKWFGMSCRRGVVALVKDAHRDCDGDVAQDAQLRAVPVRAVTDHRALGEDLRELGVEEGVEKLCLGDRGDGWPA